MESTSYKGVGDTKQENISAHIYKYTNNKRKNDVHGHFVFPLPLPFPSAPPLPPSPFLPLPNPMGYVLRHRQTSFIYVEPYLVRRPTPSFL